MAPPYLTVGEFGAYLMLIVFTFSTILFTIAMILDGGNTPLAFIGVYFVLVIGLVFSIYLVIKESR